MSEETKVKELVAASMDKIHEMADANTVMGTPVKLDGGVTVIPVSKVVYGFAGGGSDLPTKENKEFFGGGTGAGITISPLGFLVISDGKVELLQFVIPENSVIDKCTLMELPKKACAGRMFECDTSSENSFSTRCIPPPP